MVVLNGIWTACFAGDADPAVCSEILLTVVLVLVLFVWLACVWLAFCLTSFGSAWLLVRFAWLYSASVSLACPALIRFVAGFGSPPCCAWLWLALVGLAWLDLTCFRLALLGFCSAWLPFPFASLRFTPVRFALLGSAWLSLTCFRLALLGFCSAWLPFASLRSVSLCFPS